MKLFKKKTTYMTYEEYEEMKEIRSLIRWKHDTQLQSAINSKPIGRGY